MKNVWIINHYAQEPGGPGGTRHYSLAKYLSRYGWSATVIAASVELNTGRQRLKKGELHKLERCGEVPFQWLRVPTYKGNGIGRISNMIAFTARAIQKRHVMDLPRPDAIIGSSVHPLAAWAGAKWADRLGVPFIFEVRDLWPQTLVDMGRLSSGGIMARSLYRLEKILYKRADRIVVLLPRASEYIERLGIQSDKVVCIPNGVDLADFPEIPLPKERNIFELMYFGAHGNANNLANLLNAMMILRRRGASKTLRLRLIGDGPLKVELQAQARKNNFDNVFFEPPVSKERIPSLAAEADGFVLTWCNLPGIYRFGISPNKLFDYMAAGRPIVIALDAANNPVEEAGAGITVHPEDPESLADAIEKITRSTYQERVEYGKNARRYVEVNHDFPILARKLSLTLDSVCR